mmetsp:Transcript_27002/g.23840  ORF Transcript_27002/g.23840 Transcript_27002/m.23840 type:complete len:96 (+) Transcript_27002:71-358(+)
MIRNPLGEERRQVFRRNPSISISASVNMRNNSITKIKKFLPTPVKPKRIVKKCNKSNLEPYVKGGPVIPSKKKSRKLRKTKTEKTKEVSNINKNP